MVTQNNKPTVITVPMLLAERQVGTNTVNLSLFA